MKIPKAPTKNLDKSHLTDQEKRHSVALVVFAALTITLAIILSWSEHTAIFALTLIPVSAGIIGFVWGYIGAMEDERSRGA